MPELTAISDPGFSGTYQELRRYDPDLTLNGNDFIPCSTIVLWDSWSLEDESNSAGTSISLNKAGGPDADRSFNDHANWAGTAAFHVKSITHG